VSGAFIAVCVVCGKQNRCPDPATLRPGQTVRCGACKGQLLTPIDDDDDDDLDDDDDDVL